MTRTNSDKAVAKLETLAASRKIDVAALAPWIGAAWEPGRDIADVAGWLAREVDALCGPAPCAGENDGDADVWAYSWVGGFDSPWREHRNSQGHCFRDDICGPFATEEAARQDILGAIRERADEVDWPAEADSLPVKIGKRIEIFRGGRTQSEIATAAGLARSQVADIEAGRCAITVTTLAALAAALKVQPALLLA